MDPAAVILIAIGAFYVFAGLVATRAALVSMFLDKALASISGKTPSRRESRLSAWLIGSANLVLAGGATLMVRLDLALWLFVVSLAGQAIYLMVLAPRYFDVEDPPDPQGRRQTTNAALLYAVATSAVASAAYSGRLLDWREVPTPLLVAAVAFVGAHVSYTIWQARRRIAPPNEPAPDMEPLDD